MFDRLSDEGQSAFKAAHKIAKACGKSEIDTDSLLLGLVQVGESTMVARLFQDVGIWENLVRRAEALGPLPKGASLPVMQSEQIKQTIEAALACALKVDYHYPAPQHILMGMVDRCDLLTQVCAEAGVDPERLRRDLAVRIGLDANTAEDYGRHRDRILDLLRQRKEDKLVVKEIFQYLRTHLPC